MSSRTHVTLPTITKLLPHRAPMLLLDKLVDVGKSYAHCQVTPTRENLFFNEDLNGIPAWVGIEFMAQTVATWSGYHYYLQQQIPPVGFLLGTRCFSVETDIFRLNQTLDIHVEEVMSNEGMSVFSCRIDRQGQQIATCQLSTYEPTPDAQKALLKGRIG